MHLPSRTSTLQLAFHAWGIANGAVLKFASIPGFTVVRPSEPLRASSAPKKSSDPSAEDEIEILPWDPLARFLVGLGWTWRSMFFAGMLFYGVIEKLIIPGLFGYLHLEGGPRTWSPHLEALLSGFVFFPAFLAFYLWSYTSSDRLLGYLRSEALRPDPVRDEVLRQAQRTYASRWGSVICATLAVLVVLLIQFNHWADGARLPPWFGDRWAHRVLSLVMIGLVAYAVLQLIVRLTLAAYWLRQVCTRMSKQLIVNPYHPDGAGGLGRIGRYTFWYSNFVLLGVLYILLASFVDHFQNPTGASFLWSPLIIALWVVALSVMPLLFAGLLGPTHQAMCQKRDEQLAPISQRLYEELQAVQTPEGITAVGESPTVTEEIKRLKEMRQVIMDDFPVWPIGTSIRRQFRIAVLAPFVQFLVTLGLDLAKLNQ